MVNKIERVFVIGLDGAGNFIKDTDTPNIHKILNKGVLTYSAQASFPTISAECWGSVLHGVLPEKHGLNNDLIATRTYPEDSPYPSFFKSVKDVWPDSKLASFSEWEPINHGIIEQSTQHQSVSKPDGELADVAANYIHEHPDLKLMFVEFSTPDAAGHEHGYGTGSYLESITETDGYVGVLIDAIQNAGLLQSSLIIITSDHGGGGDQLYSHGSNHPQDMTVFWGCHGPGINQEAQLDEGFRNMDTAAIVLHAFGLEIPKQYDAKLPSGLFFE
ncbi:alkaline phosphatase family protein [Bacillus sp. FSL K6-3431]|uniref:alkaline phosphatase family protein n=1 Tax=Bacillus sp. FSL K6-3431 TaxID=2921500 RepID=UPI0030F87D47